MQPARDGNVRRRRMNRRIAQEINRRPRQVILRAQPLVRRRQPHLLPLALALGRPHIAGHVRVNEARRDGVDADAVRCELDAQHSREHHDGALGGIVGGHSVAGEGDMGGLRGNEKNAAADILGNHFAGDELDCEECAADLDFLADIGTDVN